MTVTRITAIAAAAYLAAFSAFAQTPGKLKVGLMLPAHRTFAALGTAIENGFKLYVAEQGGKLGGREIESSRSTTSPIRPRPTTSTSSSSATTSTSGRHRALRCPHGDAQDRAEGPGTLMIVPNAGADAAPGPIAPRTFPRLVLELAAGFPVGEVMAERDEESR